MDDIYEYDDFRRYIGDWLAAERGRSLRKLSKAVGIAPSTMSQVIKLDSAAPRKLPVRALEPLCEALELDEQEARYLVALIEHRQLRDPGERAAAWDRAEAVRGFQYGKSLSSRHYEVFSDWHHGAILEFAHCRQFRDDPAWLAENLMPPISEEAARHSLALLEELGLLVRQGGTGQLRPSVGMVIDNEWGSLELRRKAMRNHHGAMLARAAEVMVEMDSAERLVIGAMVSIAEDDLERVRSRALAAIQDALEIGNTGGDRRNRLIQVGLQVFPLSKKPEE